MCVRRWRANEDDYSNKSKVNPICSRIHGKHTNRCVWVLYTYVTKGFATRFIFAHVRTFTGVCAVVNSQSRSLNELLAASLPLTAIRTFTGMDTAMSWKIRSSRKAFTAIIPSAYILLDIKDDGRCGWCWIHWTIQIGLLMIEQIADVHADLNNRKEKRKGVEKADETMIAAPYLYIADTNSTKGGERESVSRG